MVEEENGERRKRRRERSVERGGKGTRSRFGSRASWYIQDFMLS